MPERYGDDDQPVVDFDSRRQAREAAAAVERAEQQRQRLAETRTVHAPLSGDQSKSARTHRNDVTSRAESRRNAIWIANCGLCDEHGYRGAIVCDHIDHAPTYARGMAKVREALEAAKRERA